MNHLGKVGVVVMVAAVPIFLLTLVGGIGAKPPGGPCATLAAPEGEQVGSEHLDAEQMHAVAEAIRAVRAFDATADKPHAAVIVLATGYQESKLRNLDYGDRDSLGFLQQRPSQGWGNPNQVRDVTFATHTFLRHLVQVPNWETRRVTDVAADIQRPAEEYRGLYEQWVSMANTLVERLWGTSATTSTGSAPTTTGTVRLHQANLYVGESPEQFHDDLATVVADRPDFVTLNEVYNRSTRNLQPTGYRTWHPVGPRDARDTAVLWLTDSWTLADKGTVLMHDRPVKWGTRYINWVTLTSPAGNMVSVISGHASPGGAGRTGLANQFRSRPVALIHQLDTRGPVLFGGELNVQYPHQQPAKSEAFERPYATVGATSTFAALGEPSGGWATGTRGGTIDYIIAAGAVPLRHATTTLPHSNHRMISAEIRTSGDIPSSSNSLVDVAGDTHNCDPILLALGGSVSLPVPANLASTNRNNWGGHGSVWDSWHTGTDFSVPCGTPVLAANSGTIEIDTNQGWAGRWLVKVTIGPGQLTTWYAHMERVLVTPGQVVQAGQQIGTVGKEGNTTGCHLHFEVHLKNGSIYGPDNVDPTPWLAANIGNRLAGPDGTIRVAKLHVAFTPNGRRRVYP